MTGPAVPASGRLIHAAVTAAAAAAADGDHAAVLSACAQLRACDELQTRDILHRLTLSLIEQAFPDGIAADDVRAVLAGVLRSAAGWLPELDPHAVALVLTGALSVPDDDPSTSDDAPGQLLLACVLVVSHLLRDLHLGLEPELGRTFDDLRTAQTMEMP